jgi:hypothetical protein
MNDMQAIAITAFSLLPLVIVLVELTNVLAHSLCDRFLARTDHLDDELTMARVDSLKSAVWSRIDEFDCFDSMSDLLLSKIEEGRTSLALRHGGAASRPMSGLQRSMVPVSD